MRLMHGEMAVARRAAYQGLVGMRVYVYYNLNRRTFSVMAKEGERRGRVVLHADVVYLRDVTLRVSEAGRARVLRERRRNVHAGALGILCDAHAVPDGPAHVITYNPYVSGDFLDLTMEGAPVAQIDVAQFVNRRINAWGVRPASDAGVAQIKTPPAGGVSREAGSSRPPRARVRAPARVPQTGAQKTRRPGV